MDIQVGIRIQCGRVGGDMDAFWDEVWIFRLEYGYNVDVSEGIWMHFGMRCGYSGSNTDTMGARRRGYGCIVDAWDEVWIFRFEYGYDGDVSEGIRMHCGCVGWGVDIQVGIRIRCGRVGCDTGALWMRGPRYGYHGDIRDALWMWVRGTQYGGNGDRLDVIWIK